jgi:hypothetical protein
VNDGTFEEVSIKGSNLKDQLMFAVLHERGYADIFDWAEPDRECAKRVKEQGIVDDFVQALYRDASPYVRIESCEPPLPDCQGIDRVGRKTAFEVTELVDEAMIKWNKNKYNSYRFKEYSANDLLSAASSRLMDKNQKLKSARAGIKAAGYEKTIVILHCDEPDLIQRPAFCREALSSREFPRFSEIDEAYLLLPCPRKKHLHDFEAEFCQPIRIPLPGKA